MPVKPQDIIKLLENHGWQLIRKGKGSHLVYGKNDKKTIVAMHKGKDVPKSTVRQIEKQTGIKIIK